MPRVVLVAVVLLATGCGGSKVAQTNSQTTATQLGKVSESRCSSGSAGFRACTVFHRSGGEVSRIEHRDGPLVCLLAADRAYPLHGWRRRVLADPQGEMLLAEWSGECEVPFTY
jgi:hypothetical protein